MKPEFSGQVFKKKKSQISSFIKIRLVGAEFFHADRQMVIKLTVVFRNFGKAPTNLLISHKRL